MFTTGSKLFFGATALSVACAVVFAASTGGPTGIMGTVGLLSLAIVFGFLAGINFFNADGNVPGMQQGAEYTAAAAQPPVGSSMWPLVAAVGVAGLVVGAGTPQRQGERGWVFIGLAHAIKGKYRMFVFDGEYKGHIS